MQKQIDYSFKSNILKNYNSLLVAERKATMFSYSLSRYRSTGEANYTMKRFFNGSLDYCETYQQLKKYCDITNLSKELKECERINHAWFERVKRLQDRIETILMSSPSSFITLTFTNKVLQETSAETRRRYVARWCKQYGVAYVGNIDFGKNTNREHYHVIIAKTIQDKNWPYGFMDIENINTDNTKSVICLSKYVSKLTNHAIKETTKRCCMIYSRNMKRAFA